MSNLFFSEFACYHERLPDLYHLSFPRDKWTVKSLVYFVYFTDMAQTCLVTYDIVNAYARHYGNLDVLESLQLEPIAVPMFTSIGKHLP